jgi:hypothetical protein
MSYDDNGVNAREVTGASHRGVFGHRKNKSSSAVVGLHGREEWKLPPMAKREDVKKTRKQVGV